MKAATAIGIGIASAAIIVAGIMEGVAPPALLNINALLIVLGGTGGAIFAGVGMKRFMAIPKLYMKAFMTEAPDLAARVKTLVSFAERARKDEVAVKLERSEFLRVILVLPRTAGAFFLDGSFVGLIILGRGEQFRA